MAGMTEQVAVETERLTACPLCGGSDRYRWGRCRDLEMALTEQEFAYCRCRACGLVYLDPRPTAAGAARLYPGHYRPYRQPPALRRGGVVGRAALAALGVVLRLFPDTAADRIAAAYHVSTGALLDFGCGSPAFLDRARAAGWSDTIGVDFSDEVVARVRASGHRACTVAEAWAAVEPGTVAAVRMNHVLEHLYDPQADLRRLHALLQPGGRVHIAVPNPCSYTALAFRGSWWSADPRHVMLFPPPLLRGVVEGAGFVVTDLLHETVTKDAARSVAHAIGGDRERLRQRARRYGESDLLRAALLLPARLAAALGRSDRIHLLAHA